MLSSRLTAGARKLRWGVRTVGVFATARGLVRLLGIRLRRPNAARLHLASGGELRFDYPSQMVPVLVIFGDLIDPEFALLRKIGRPDWRFLDVGAAIGQFTVFATMSLRGTVHAFEPDRRNLHSLDRNLKLNGIVDSVTVHPIALSRERGEARFPETTNSYLGRLGDAEPVTATGHVVEVRTLTDIWDELGIDRAEVLKINVAGFEPAVIQGTLPLLADGRVDLLILLLGTSSYEWYPRIAALGYRFFFYHPKSSTLQEIATFTEGTMGSQPWPARHIIAVRDGAIRDGMLDGVRISPTGPK